MKTLWTGLGLLIAFSIAIVALSYCGAFTSVATAPARVVNKTLRTDNIINNYEWFKQQYADVQAIDQKIEVQKVALSTFETSAGNRTNWSFEDKQEQARLITVIAGLQGQRADMIAMYNARSQMANRSLFKTHDLPEQLQ